MSYLIFLDKQLFRISLLKEKMSDFVWEINSEEPKHGKCQIEFESSFARELFLQL